MNIPYRLLLPEGWTLNYIYRNGDNQRFFICDTKNETRFYIGLDNSPDRKYENICRINRRLLKKSRVNFLEK